jgi:hypothetical protein
LGIGKACCCSAEPLNRPQSFGLGMVDVVKAARVGFGLQIDYLLRLNAHAGHAGGYCRVAAFVALGRRTSPCCSTVKAETGVAIQVSDGAGEPDKNAGGIAYSAVGHPGFKITEADETPDVYCFPYETSFDIENDTCLRHVGRDLVEFLVVAALNHADYADDVRPIGLWAVRDLGGGGWCCDQIDGDCNNAKLGSRSGHFSFDRQPKRPRPKSSRSVAKRP